MSDGYSSFGTVHGPVNSGSGNQNVGSGTQYNAGGSIYHAGRDQAIAAQSDAEVAAEIAKLRQALADLRLTGTERQAADDELAAAQDALHRPEPDRAAAGSHLATVLRGLKDAGALATAGVVLLESVKSLAAWIGPAGLAIIGLL